MFGADDMLIAAFATQAMGSLFGGEAQSKADEYKAQIAMQNAAIAREQGAAAAAAQERIAYKTQGSIIAAYGASGVQSDNGSPMDVLANSAAMATLDNLTIKYNAQLKALGYENDAAMARAGAANAKTSALLNAAAYAMKAGSTYMKYNGSPIPNFGGGDAAVLDSTAPEAADLAIALA